MNESMRLLMAQVDDVPGELLGEFMMRVDELGARNVQIVASITKKNRPGYIIYVDVPAHLEDAVAELFGAELGTWGYRVIAAEHKHFSVERLQVALEVHTAGAAHQFNLAAKRITTARGVSRLKAEHDDLSAICTVLREHGTVVPLATLKAAVEAGLVSDDDRDRVSVRF